MKMSISFFMVGVFSLQLNSSWLSLVRGGLLKDFTTENTESTENPPSPPLLRHLLRQGYGGLEGYEGQWAMEDSRHYN